MVDDFWKRIKLALVIRGIDSLKTLCEENAISYQTMLNEKSLHIYPPVSVLITLSKALDCSVDWLLFGEAEVPGAPRIS